MALVRPSLLPKRASSSNEKSARSFPKIVSSATARKNRRVNLRLDSLNALLEGGESGKVVVPGQPENSRLIKAVKYEDADLQMPPKKKLSDRQVADLIEWVKLGVPWPETEKNQAQRPNRPAFEITGEDRAYWAFQPIKRLASTRGETETLDSQSNRCVCPRGT